VTAANRAPPAPKEPEGLLGIPPELTQVALQTDVFKELVNKLSWALGSSYRRSYANSKTRPRQLAIKIATRLILQEGYPQHIQKERAP